MVEPVVAETIRSHPPRQSQATLHIVEEPGWAGRWYGRLAGATMGMALFAVASVVFALTTRPAFAAPVVVASIKPVHSLVAAVMAGVAEPALIVEGAGSPHAFALKPSKARTLESADLIFWIGPELETFLEKPIGTLGTRARVVTLADVDGVIWRRNREGGAFEAHEHGDEDVLHHDHDAGHHDIDMHLWLDPENAKAFATAIAVVLEQADPANAERYRANAADLAVRLDALSGEIAATLGPVRKSPFIVFHDAYHYFEARFGLTAAGSLTVSPEVAPGAERVRSIIAKVKQSGAVCIFAEPQFAPKLVATISAETGVRLGTLDPLGAEIDDGAELYFALLDRLAASMRTCLGGE